MKSRIFERMIQEKLFLYKNLRSIGEFINKISTWYDLKSFSFC